MKLTRTMKIGIGGLSLFVFGVSFGWMLFPMVLKSQVHKQVALKDGSEMRGMWSKFPFYLEFRMWLFNVTNPDEIKNGAKPIVREVGPYFFEEWQEKTTLTDREEDDTVEYAIKNKWIFRPDLSEGLTGDEELTLPHVFILAMVMTVVREKPTMVPVINKAVNSIFKNPDNVFVKVKAMDMLFNGLPIDCTVTDFAGGAVCGMLRDAADDLQKDGVDMYRFSFLGAKNDTPASKRVRVLRGVKNLMDVGMVVEWDGKTNISKWDDDHCDTLQGTDGTIFHPFFYENEDVVSFAPDLCRSLPATYTGKKVKISGLTTNRYSAFLGDPNTDPSQKCYCPTPDTCLKKGVMDLFKCVGAPLVASHPHFHLADEAYLNMVDGLSPSEEQHGIFLDFEPFTGSPLSARKRLQFNIMIHKVDKFKVMKNFPEALLPLFWVEEGIVLPDYLVKQVKAGHQVVKIVKYMKWIMTITGLLMTGGAGFMYYRDSQKANKLEITKVVKNGSKPGSTEKKISPINVSTLQQAQVPPNLD